MCFKSTPRQPRRHGRASALDRNAAAGRLRGNEMPGLPFLVQRLARKRLARDRDPPYCIAFEVVLLVSSSKIAVTGKTSRRQAF